MKIKSKLSCQNHLDMAFDDFLLEEEIFPTLLKAEEGICDYCKDAAVYILINHGDTKADECNKGIYSDY